VRRVATCICAGVGGVLEYDKVAGGCALIHARSSSSFDAESLPIGRAVRRNVKLPSRKSELTGELDRLNEDGLFRLWRLVLPDEVD
jgi:hypothetical protein